MLNELFLLLMFAAKAIIIVIITLLLLVGIIGILSRGKEKLTGRIVIKNLNEKFSAVKEQILQEVLSKDLFKKFLKEKKQAEKNKKKQDGLQKEKKVFVLNFNGDIKASAVTALREEVSAILAVAEPKDEVVVRLESPGGMVHAYGLAASQLQRLRDRKISLTVVVDKIAASGGYMMACVANKIIAAPFAIIGSIGVVMQLPNFNRLLKEKHVDFEQLTAGNFKRTLTMFGHNTEEAREKVQQEINEIHMLFKNMIKQNRQQIDIEKVATGEYWPGSQALELKLVDEIWTSDDYLLNLSRDADLYEICYQTKKSLGQKLSAGANALMKNVLEDRYSF